MDCSLSTKQMLAPMRIVKKFPREVRIERVAGVEQLQPCPQVEPDISQIVRKISADWCFIFFHWVERIPVVAKRNSRNPRKDIVFQFTGRLRNSVIVL